MANRVLSVEVGYSFTKVCELDYKAKNPKIYNSFVIATPEGMMTDGVIKMNEVFLDMFRRKLVELSIKTRKVIFSVASTKIATREAKIPYCKENKITDIVRANLSEYFPIDSSQYLISHSILGVEYDGEVEKTESDNPFEYVEQPKKKGKPDRYKLLLLAAPKTLLDTYHMLAKALDLEVTAIDYNGNSIYQAAKDECKDGIQMIIKVDERSSLILVLKNGSIVMNRTIPYGVDDAIQTLTECRSLGETYTYEKAMAVARKKNCFYTTFNEKEQLMVVDIDTQASQDNSIEAQKDKKDVTKSLTSLINGISRVVDYYNANNSQDPIEKMYVTGVGADIMGLTELMSTEVDSRVKTLTHLAGLNLEKMFKDITVGEFVGCIGAVMAPLNFYVPDKAEEMAAKKSGGITLDQAAIIVVVGSVILSAVLVATSLIPYYQELDKKKGYEQTIAELQPIYDQYLEYNQLSVNVEKMKAVDKLSHNRNEELVTFINTLEEKMPSSFWVSSLTASTNGITLGVTVETKEEVATVLEELWQLSSFSYVDTSSVTELVSEDGELKYAFAIDMVYSEMVDDAVVEEE